MPREVAVVHDKYLEMFHLAGNQFRKATTRRVVGVTKLGSRVNLTVALSVIVESLLSALIHEEDDHTFSLTCGPDGLIKSVQGHCFATCGYSPPALVGENVTQLCPRSISSKHKAMMKAYRSAADSQVVGHTRNREMLHFAGHCVAISLEVVELSKRPLLFSATITEGVITSCDLNCALIFGYEEDEPVGESVALLSNRIVLSAKEPRQLLCHHHDGSKIFVSVTMESSAGGYLGVIHRMEPPGASKSRSILVVAQDKATISDLVGWYKVTREVLGTGLCGDVKIARHRLAGVQVAIKTLTRKQYDESGLAYPPREVELMQRVSHPLCARLWHTIVSDDSVVVISELVEGGELLDYVVLPEHDARRLMRQIVSAVSYLHQQGIVHRDLKLENILLDEWGSIKLIDFGLGNFCDSSGETLLTTFCGSPDYAPPEVWQSQAYVGPEVDVWSLGVILYVLVTGYVPFNSCAEVVEMRHRWPEEIVPSAQLQDLVGKIFKDSSERISMQGIIDHRWLTNDGKLPSIHVSSPVRELDEKLLQRCVELGLPHAELKEDLRTGKRNNLTATYHMLEAQEEDAKRRRDSNPLLGELSPVAVLEKISPGRPAPRARNSGDPVVGTHRSTRNSGDPVRTPQCIIA